MNGNAVEKRMSDWRPPCGLHTFGVAGARALEDFHANTDGGLLLSPKYSDTHIFSWALLVTINVLAHFTGHNNKYLQKLKENGTGGDGVCSRSPPRPLNVCWFFV